MTVSSAATGAQKNLMDASYRGVPFYVTSTKLKVGRRVVLFEYPQQDKPFVEDLGRAARIVTVNAFTTGRDYAERMSALVKALETQGGGELVDPWVGRMTATPQSVSQVTYTTRLRLAQISITFVESGELSFPTAAISTHDDVCIKADGIAEAAQNYVGTAIDLSGAQDFVVSNIVGKLESALKNEGIQSLATMFKLDKLDELAKVAATVLTTDPGSFASTLVSSLGLGSFVETVRDWRRVAYLAQGISYGADFNVRDSILYPSGTADYETAKAVEAINTGIRLISISNAVGAAGNIGTGLDRVDETQPSQVMAYDDMIAVRDSLLSAIDNEMLKVSDDSVYSALSLAYSSVWNDMTVRAENKARLIDYTPEEIMPALVLAYDYYGDAARDTEIVERNGIRRPAFVPAKPLKLLST